MLKNTCCSICLSLTKRTINIYNTDLQYVYENLTNFKIRDIEFWMCYICHSRLRQCHQLKQLAVQTRGLVDDLFHNKIDIRFGSINPLLELSVSKINITSSNDIKEESDEEFHTDDGSEENEILGNSLNHEEEKTYVKSEDEEPAQESPHVNAAFLNSKDHELKVVKISQVNVEYASPNITPNLLELLNRKKQSLGAQSTKNIEIKQEIKDETRDKDTDQNIEQDSTSNHKEQENASVVRTDRRMRPLSCEICYKNFKYNYQLRGHLRIHTGEKPFTCNICLKKFTNKANLKSHYMFSHAGMKYSCDICSKEISNEYNLRRHKLLHSDEKPFSCDVCSKSFSLLIQLNKHKQIHTGDKPFTCDVCSKKFSHQSHLIGHKRIHSGEKPFSCDICSQKFAYNSKLKRHMQTHTGETPYSCAICSKRFTSKDSYDDHTLIHTGEKKHVCHICGKKFALKRYLNIHLLSHTGIKKYTCDICSKRFTQKSSLNTHKKTHESL